MRFKIGYANVSPDIREHFELYGTDVIALVLGLGSMTGQGIGSAPVQPTTAMMVVFGNQKEAAAWLREKRDQAACHETVRFWGMLILTAVAAIAACVAAWPIIKG
jgi:hypothetical protein